jgi:hypothetical protein
MQSVLADCQTILSTAPLSSNTTLQLAYNKLTDAISQLNNTTQVDVKITSFTVEVV